MKFSKAPLTPEQHVQLLLDRGLIIEDTEMALRCISNIGYFRLTGYMYPLQENDGSHAFKKDISFDTIMSFYNFDRKLRHLISDAIERLEVALRSIISDAYALSYGSHWYLETDLFKKVEKHADFLAKIKAFCGDCDFQFIRSYLNKYTDPKEPPVWMLMETLTFGQLSLLFENLKGTDEKVSAASKFKAVPPILESWLLSINSLRNFCAHHSRIWNRKFAIKPKLPIRESMKILNYVEEDTNWRLYGVLSCIVHMLKQVDPDSDFKNQLKTLFKEYGYVNLAYLGFKDSWEKEPLWA